MTQKIYYINSKDLLCEYTVIKQDDLFYYLQNESGVEYIKNKTDCFETAKDAVKNKVNILLVQAKMLRDRAIFLENQIK